jgi:hypothetical protein
MGQDLENALAAQAPHRLPKDGRRVVGRLHDSEFMREVDDTCRHRREAEHEAARPPLGKTIPT